MQKWSEAELCILPSAHDCPSSSSFTKPSYSSVMSGLLPESKSTEQFAISFRPR